MHVLKSYIYNISASVDWMITNCVSTIIKGIMRGIHKDFKYPITRS